jgi:hypothetical protein
MRRQIPLDYLLPGVPNEAMLLLTRSATFISLHVAPNDDIKRLVQAHWGPLQWFKLCPSFDVALTVLCLCTHGSPTPEPEAAKHMITTLSHAFDSPEVTNIDRIHRDICECLHLSEADGRFVHLFLLCNARLRLLDSSKRSNVSTVLKVFLLHLDLDLALDVIDIWVSKEISATEAVLVAILEISETLQQDLRWKNDQTYQHRIQSIIGTVNSSILEQYSCLDTMDFDQ